MTGLVYTLHNIVACLQVPITTVCKRIKQIPSPILENAIPIRALLNSKNITPNAAIKPPSILTASPIQWHFIKLPSALGKQTCANPKGAKKTSKPTITIKAPTTFFFI